MFEEIKAPKELLDAGKGIDSMRELTGEFCVSGLNPVGRKRLLRVSFAPKLLSLLTSVALVFGLCPSVAFADAEDGTTSATIESDGQVQKDTADSDCVTPLDPATSTDDESNDVTSDIPHAEQKPDTDGAENAEPPQLDIDTDAPSTVDEAKPKAPVSVDGAEEDNANAINTDESGSLSADERASSLDEERTKTIDGVTYTYKHRGGRGWGIHIIDTTYAPKITVPEHIDGQPVVSFKTYANEYGTEEFALDVSKCASLKYLECEGSNLLSLDVSKCTKLEELFCNENHLTSLNVSKCTKLEILSCSGNSLVSLNTSKCTELTALSCAWNNLASLNVNQCTALDYLDCNGNDLVSLDVSRCAALKTLHVGSNNFTSLDVSRCAVLRFLTCYNNNLTFLDVNKCTELRSLECYSNNLISLDVDKCLELENLWCYNNYIDNIEPLTARFGTKSNNVLPQYNARAPRLSGATALDTMAAITNVGFATESCSTVIVATMGGYWDALAASALAGLNNCPILLTDGSVLSAQTASEIRRLKPSKVYVVGGTAAISPKVETSLKTLPEISTVKRLAGNIAVNTALEIYKQGKDSWAKTAVVATSETFQDALSISPYAYAKKAPIFLANASTHKLDDQVATAIKQGGFDHVIIVGGTAALSGQIEKQQLKGISCKRLAGATAYETSGAIAKWCLTQDMTAANVGVATGDGYWDALAGAAFCGKNNSVLVLVADSNRTNINGFLKSNRASIQHAYIFGGSAAVSNATRDAITTVLG